MEVNHVLASGVIYQYHSGSEVTIWVGMGVEDLGYIAWTSVPGEDNSANPNLTVDHPCLISIRDGGFKRTLDPEEWTE